MRLTQLRVNNYRSLVDIDLPLRDLAVVIGPNGVGKSALLEVFLLLQHGSQQGLQRFFELQGGFHTVVRQATKMNSALHLQIGVAVDVESDKSSSYMTYDLDLVGERLGYKIGSERLEWRIDPKKPNPFVYIDSDGQRIRYASPDSKGLVELEGYRVSEPALAQVPRLYREPEQLRTLLSNTRVYGPLDVASRSIVRSPQPLTPARQPGANGENLYSSLYNLRTLDPNTYERLELLLRQAFPDFKRLEFPVVGAGQVTLAWYDRDTNGEFYPNQLSEGTLRFVWLAAILLSPELAPLVLLDEPEVSLHPELLKLLAALLQDTSARSQIIVATHSPDLIRWLNPDEVLVADKIEGVTTFTWADTLNLEEWLSEYTLRDLWLMGNLGGRP